MTDPQYGEDSHYNTPCKNHPELVATEGKLCEKCHNELLTSDTLENQLCENCDEEHYKEMGCLDGVCCQTTKGVEGS